MAKVSVSSNRLPNFIIGGAPKCGTTSLHFILAQHPNVGMPNEELHYFDADDPITHPDFLKSTASGLDWFDTRAECKPNFDWYTSRFTAYHDRDFIGEDSTTYLFSAVAARRIKNRIPNVRMIFALRDPVKRAYSQYWHLIRSARLSCSFEDALSHHSSIILGSTYKPHLADYIDVFGKEAVHVAVFEDFLKDQQSYIDAATDHIKAPRMSLENAQTWFNRTYYPTHPKAQQTLNRIGKFFVDGRYRNHMGHETGALVRFRSKMHYRWFHYINPILLKAEKPPTMNPETAEYLTHHLSDRNQGLSDLLDRDLSEIWSGFKG